MVKATFNLGNYNELDDLFNGKHIDLEIQKNRKAVFVDENSHNKISLIGKHFSYDDHSLAGGTVTGVEFTNQHGGKYVAISGASYDVEEVQRDLTHKSMGNLIETLFKGDDLIFGSSRGGGLYGAAGNDTIKGNDGHDFIIGGDGNDTLIGGDGSDTFAFHHGDGHDKIVDFDPDGGFGHQDFIGIDSTADMSIHKSGKDTAVEFSDGTTITLVGVSSSHVTLDDFVVA